MDDWTWLLNLGLHIYEDITYERNKDEGLSCFREAETIIRQTENEFSVKRKEAEKEFQTEFMITNQLCNQYAELVRESYLICASIKKKVKKNCQFYIG